MTTATMDIEDYKKTHLNKDLPPVHITFVIDRSGSMSSIASDVEGSINGFIKDQRKVPGECRVTLWQFDSEAVEKILRAEDVHKAEYKDFKPRGMTPLYDAIGKAIIDTDNRDSDEKQILVIMTDGMENASHEFTREQVFSLIKEREEKGWILSYLAANQDAFAVGGGMGFNAMTTRSYSPTRIGVRNLYSGVSLATNNARTAWNAGEVVDSSNFYDPDEYEKDKKEILKKFNENSKNAV